VDERFVFGDDDLGSLKETERERERERDKTYRIAPILQVY
jgi:hypothetical protein